MPVIIKKKYAPCGHCGEIVPRDDMHSVNIKVYDPDDRNEVKIPIRTCEPCRKAMLAKFEPMRWSNGSMFTRDEVVDEEPVAQVG